MRHILETQARKQAAIEAGLIEPSYSKYKAMVEKARLAGYSNHEIIDELRKEEEVIRQARHEGNDPNFKMGVENAKRSCLNAIELVISELSK